MGKKDDDIWTAVAGLFLGAIGVAIISELAKPKCPNCKKIIEKGVPFCPHCGIPLTWNG